MPLIRLHLGYALIAISICLPLAITACGDSDPTTESTESISESDLKDAVQAAKQKEQIKALEGKVEDLQEGDGGTAAATGPVTDLRSSGGGVAFTTYTDGAAGWTAEIPTGGGWSQPTQSQPTPGALFETQLVGPDGLFLVVDYTPNEAPSFGGAPVDSRTTVSTPNFGTVEKIVFQGNSNFPLCDAGLCVDYLVPSGSGGYGVLAGGGGDLSDAEAVAERVLATLQG